MSAISSAHSAPDFLPEPYLCESRRNCEKLLESYASIYLKEEIQSESLTRNLPGFARFLTTGASRIYPFDQSPDVDSIKHPKLYFFDGGVLNGLLGSFDTSVVRSGALFEQSEYSQLINSSASRDQRLEISFFRTRGGVEVDFIITLGGKVWAVEAKAGQVDKGDLDGLRRFREYYPMTHRCIIVSPSEPKRQVDGIVICGVADMLRELGL